MWCTCLYTDTHSALQNTHPVIPAWRGNERVVWSASYSCYYCSQWKNVSLWAQEAIKFSTENEKECEWVKISEKREEEDRWRERKEWHNVCQMRKGGEMKSVIRFHGGTSPTFKEPFRSSCTSVFLFKASSSSNKQQTLSERRSLLQQQPEVFGFVFFWGAVFHMTKAFEFSGPEINPSRCQPLCARVCRDTCNEQIWCWFLGAAFALISACLQAFLSPAASA